MKISKMLFNEYTNNSDYDAGTNRLYKGCFAKQESAGIFAFTPLGTKLVQYIEQVIRKHLDKVDYLEVLLPLVQTADLWKKSGRYDKYGSELFRLSDRNNQSFVLAPTAEESVTELVNYFVNSYKNLPVTVYQIRPKYRDEMRPRYGLIRGKEFIMKDAYGFYETEDQMKEEYLKMKQVYIDIFEELNLNVISVATQDTGEIGGSFSEEFVILDDIGEGLVYKDNDKYTFNDNGTQGFRYIELGHIFCLDQVYTHNTSFTTKDNKREKFFMGCYGIGITRILSALLMKNKYIPSSFDFYFIGSENLYNQLSLNYKILYDDKSGNPFERMEAIGISKRIIERSNYIEYLTATEKFTFTDIEKLLTHLESNYAI